MSQSLQRISEISLAPNELVRLSRPEDNSDLCDLFAQTPMRGDLVLATDRSPHFSALYDLQKGEHECWVFLRDGKICGCCALIVRDGWVNGKHTKVCYLGDLRTSPRARAVSRYYGQLLRSVTERHDVQHFYTCLMASNRAAILALTRRSKERSQQPRYALLRNYDAVQIHFSLPKMRRRTRNLRIGPATPSDTPEIAKHLHQDHQRRPFGYRYDRGEFEHRLKAWPGFTLEKTYLARDPEGQLVGLATVWDAWDVKRYRVLEYRGTMRWVKRLLSLSSLMVRHPPLPREGDCFRYAYLSNLSVPAERPEVLQALLRHIYVEQFRMGYHFLMLYLEQGSPLSAGLKGFTCQRVAFQQFCVRPPTAPDHDYGPGLSGFEIALA